MNLTTLPSMLDIIGELFPEHTSIAVSDADRYIYYKPSRTIDLQIRPGDKIKEGTATYKALTSRQKISAYIDARVFGIPYFGMSVPFFEQGQPAGCVTAILPAKPSPLPFLTVKTSDRWVPVSFETIMYAEAQNRKTRIKAERVEGFHKANLSELEFLLPDDQFLRVHRSYLVNLHYIREIHPDSHSTFLLLMHDQSKIPVSQTYASSFRRKLRF
ncbi:LytTR family transcriptional regulator [Brevibacillus sp. SYP-B805]|uniref:LytTR family transcriptional regulator DNA-binding domain-containing protein n=1 Tax=Brevibacillus sp. SYP-B805 TaxID=1578199 RepID=UPI0013ED9E88|nr:LytTR family transcriptional regulator [Brevibacillus sp. SYP-B805]